MFAEEVKRTKHVDSVRPVPDVHISYVAASDFAELARRTGMAADRKRSALLLWNWSRPGKGELDAIERETCGRAPAMEIIDDLSKVRARRHPCADRAHCGRNRVRPLESGAENPAQHRFFRWI